MIMPEEMTEEPPADPSVELAEPVEEKIEIDIAFSELEKLKIDRKKGTRVKKINKTSKSKN